MLSPFFRFVLVCGCVASTAVAISYDAVDPYDWLNQCVPPFQDSNFATLIDHSNFELIDKPAGLCADFLACAFERCVLPPEGIAVLNSTSDASEVTPSSGLLMAPGLPNFNLPAHIAFPQTAKDVVDLVKIAEEKCWTISIKNGGHSHHGASTMKDSLQLNLRNLQGYANSSQGILQCDTIANNENDPASRACRRAMANGKAAVIRVGGGEVWDYVYRAVLVWNQDHEDDLANQYDVVGGGAGSVSSIGGWMQGGGLSIGDERMYGLGVDQVMELQMVLANGMHVKFGPSQWGTESTPSSLYPVTTKVEACATGM